jgi:hypothetical protein
MIVPWVCLRYDLSMRRLRRLLFNLLAAVSLLLCIGVCVLWWRSRSGYDMVQWMYDRWLPDGSAASTWVQLTSNKRAVWLDVSWGEVGPPTGQLVWGYYMNANDSGGRPRLRFHYDRYAAMDDWAYSLTNDGTSGWGPLRWQTGKRSRPKDGDDHRSIRIGLSHWLLVVLLVIPPAVVARRIVASRGRRKRGRCRSCGYDLRATPQETGPLVGQCPECGTRV